MRLYRTLYGKNEETSRRTIHTPFHQFTIFYYPKNLIPRLYIIYISIYIYVLCINVYTIQNHNTISSNSSIYCSIICYIIYAINSSYFSVYTTYIWANSNPLESKIEDLRSCQKRTVGALFGSRILVNYIRINACDT